MTQSNSPTPTQGGGTSAMPIRSRLTGASREPVSEVQHARILGAFAEVARERGIAAVTVTHVVARAGVSRRTFYNLFEDRTACFVAVLDDAVARLERIVTRAWRSEARWIDKVRAGLLALLAFWDEQPVLANVCVVQSVAGGSEILAWRAGVMAALVDAVDQGREHARGTSPSPLVAEGLVGAVLAIVHARLLESEAPCLVELLNPLMELIVLPYLGPAVAGREASRPAPSRPEPELAGGTHEDSGDPRVADLDMRVTYRTLRVLSAIGEQPGANNREVGARAEISDQGQISKLLRRLEGLGLVANTGEGQRRGAANSWWLTAQGTSLRRVSGLEPG
jgi:AcrR family transcriptional regulator